tara:strand:+ start:103 stop:480 length:378 start_codon:yes stop_codon:yes gene_type:complete
MEDWNAMMSDEDEDDGPQHDPGHSALVVAQPPAEAPARTSTVLVSSSATVAEATLKGYRKQVVWSVYKDVMESVLGEVRQLVEQEGLEPSVATDIREVRPTQRILASAQPHSAPRNCRGRNGRSV